MISYNRRTVNEIEEEKKKPDMLWLNLLVAGLVIIMAAVLL